jgi:hypothetical protein
MRAQVSAFIISSQSAQCVLSTNLGPWNACIFGCFLLACVSAALLCVWGPLGMVVAAGLP